MCGITGFWQPAGLREGDTTTLARMTETLHHRGPDGRGHHVDAEIGLAMGHTRLSIIDLSETGAQPFFDREARLVLTANGEFYDYKTLRTQMACRGEAFESKSDSEVALKLYKHQGLDFVHSLRGEFAFALYDAREDRLVLVRDRFGVRPLFYHLTDDRIVWGSEVKAVLAHPQVPRRIDKKAALHQMMQCMVPGTSAFEGVRAMEPGTILVVTRKGGSLETRTVRYWDMDFPREQDHDANADPQPYIDAVTDKLIDAVRARLEADVPVGCYLSGGIDSCSILGLSTAMQQSAVKAFTISFDHDAYDEASIAREMAEKTGADQELLELDAATLYGDHYVTTLRHAERTFYNTLGVAKWHMSRRVRECGFKVVVTGEGSDELFGGYPFFKRDYFTHSSDGDEQLHAALDKSNEVFKGAILSEELVEHPAWNDLCGFTPSWIQPWIKTLELVRPLFRDSVLDELEDYDPIAAIAEKLDAERVRGRHALDKVQYTWIKTMLEGQILNWGGDRVDMANSMESRPAFLDHHLAELARTIPPNLRIRGGVEKWVLREAMKGVLPQVLYEREKFAFMAPPAHTDERKRHAVEQLIETRMSKSAVDALGLFDAKRIQAFLDAHWKGTDAALSARNDIVLNHLLGLHVIHQELGQG